MLAHNYQTIPINQFETNETNSEIIKKSANPDKINSVNSKIIPKKKKVSEAYLSKSWTVQRRQWMVLSEMIVLYDS